MNILFLYGNVIDPQKGGVQRVTSVLADYFVEKDHSVLYLALEQKKNHQCHPSRQFFLPDKASICSKINIDFIREFVKNKKIDILINQGGIVVDISKLTYSLKNENVKILQVVHNSLLSKINHFESAFYDRFKAKKISFVLPVTKNKLVKNILLQIYKRRYASHFKELCSRSDQVVLLSRSFMPELRFFVGDSDFSNVTAISNPCSFLPNSISTVKQKEILFVGRINSSQKRVDLLLRIWARLHHAHPDWKLIIVGGGDLPQMKKFANILNLQNFSFEGFQDPAPYYERASIFAMTSSFEGFPMVLPEAMQYGLVPFAFNSFASVNDIIDDDVNGCLIKPFEIDEYVSKLKDLMINLDQLRLMSLNAQEKSKQFNITHIGNQWLQLFEELKHHDDKYNEA